LAKAKRELTPEQEAQAAKMKELLEQRKAERLQRDAATTRGANAGGGWAHGVDAKQIRSGRRGNR
jgi:uncharacterized ferredoxin-like protein